MRWTPLAVMAVFVPLVLISATRMASSGSSESAELAAESGPPPEMAQLAPLIGEWRCVTKTLQPDGSYRSGEATWKFFYILDGFAILDEWRSTKPDGAPTLGVNIRHYDLAAGHWVARWLSTSDMQWKSFEATYGEGRFVMTGQGTTATGEVRDSRVTFYHMKKRSFRWRLDWSMDGGETWIEGVFLIEGTRTE